MKRAFPFSVFYPVFYEAIRPAPPSHGLTVLCISQAAGPLLLFARKVFVL